MTGLRVDGSCRWIRAMFDEPRTMHVGCDVFAVARARAFPGADALQSSEFPAPGPV